MSETPIYFVLAQLHSLMTASLRLALSILFLMAVVLALSLWQNKWKAFATYLNGWLLMSSGAGLLASLGQRFLFPASNHFIDQGVYSSLALLSVGSVFAIVAGLKLTQTRWLQASLSLGLLALCVYGLQAADFSRSDKVLASCLLALPLSLNLIYFPLLFDPQHQQYKHFFHLIWGLSAPISLGIYFIWLEPILSGIPQEGEFYPFINLYHWFLLLVMILYLGNLYIDYWLKQGNSRFKLTISWHYLITFIALLGLWLNANIFDTLAI